MTGSGQRPPPTGKALAALTLGAMGVVYGDIGTSVLYAVKEIFADGRVSFSPANVYGVLSLIFWTLTTIVSLKYVTLVLRADNHGEGGLVAMLALASQSVGDRPHLRRALMLVGIFGTCLFYGDGVITPAISVLSAVEGLREVSPELAHWVLPITLLVLTALFLVQRHGTGGIGRFFGPLMLLWFAGIAALGVMHIVGHPEILQAVWPGYALGFIARQPGTAFIILGAVILCVTGAEALYADMGHFGRLPIRLAWFGVAMPALTLNYFGQGALLLANPAAVSNPFFSLAPGWLTLPLVLLATAATVIASQALISGAFSVTKQVIQLGYLPRLRIIHTHVRDTGQIYIPLVNWLLFGAIAFAVLMFRSSSELASAYGVAVTTDMLITTVLTFFVIRFGWRLPLALCVAATGFFLVIDLAFWASNLTKLFDGGWFPLLIGATVYGVMLTWHDGRVLMNHALQEGSIDLKSMMSALCTEFPTRVSGTAVFLANVPGVAPNALLHNLKHNKVLHETNLFVTVEMHEVPWVGLTDRIQVEKLAKNSWQVAVHYGFKNDMDLPKALALLAPQGVSLDPMTTSYFISREKLIPDAEGGMALWRERLFAQMLRNSSSLADYLNLPSNAVVELGAQVKF
ncbi:potassium transporter Kup [Comamonas serinivorans]|uniref:Probable potassium transport system protein Kup n=1 Tax=Comamonas serinivorans TaxID=1082851 RepID=A0A1Y0EJC1_9BURK|nr:potassium transporter Kup [Comamonas serinivorans]ARU03560.1 potassium transporter Kup [Comamonas serinivorans]